MAIKDFKVKAGLQVPSLTTAGPVLTDASGNISSSSVISVSNGGTGQTTANNALNALLPIQNGNTINYAIQSDGTNVSWQKIHNQVIKDNGTTVNARRILNLVGFTLSDDAGNDVTTVTAGGGNAEIYSLMGVY